MKFLLTVLLIVFGPSIAEPQAIGPSSTSTVLVDLRSIAGKSEADVQAVLGSASSEETVRSKGHSYPKRTYRNGHIEVVFVNGKSDWITIHGRGELPYSSEALQRLGLPSMEPTFSNPVATIRWNNVPGLREVSLFPLGSATDYAYVLVSTTP